MILSDLPLLFVLQAGPVKGSSVRVPGAEAKMGIANGEKFICYMCYETHDTAEVRTDNLHLI